MLSFLHTGVKVIPCQWKASVELDILEQKVYVHEHQDETHNDSGVEPTEDHLEWVHFSQCGWSFTVATQNESNWDQLSTF